MPKKSEEEKINMPTLNVRRGPGGFGGPGHHYMGAVVKPKDPIGTLKRLWRYLDAHKFRLILVFTLTAVTSVLMLMGPYLIGKAIDDFIIPKDFKGLFSIILVMISIYLLSSIFTWIQNYFMINIAQRSVLEMRKDLFNKLQVLPLKFFDTRPHGDLMSRLTNDLDNVSNTLTASITQIFSGVITLIGTVVMMLFLSPKLTLITL
ncbi:MAG: ABC transporter ATP-binding protein, partial [bacterium]